MRKLRGWFWGWRETIRIRLFEPELWHYLTRELNEGDFGEVYPPEEDQ